MSLTKLSLGGNNDVIYKVFLPRENLVSDIPAGDKNIEKLFLRCMVSNRGDRDLIVFLFLLILLSSFVQCISG